MDARELFLSEQTSSEEVEQFLSDLGLREPRVADTHLQELVGLVGYPERVADLAPPLLDEIAGSVDPDAAIRNLVSVVESAPNRLNFFALLESSPRVIEILIGILGASPFLTQLIVRNPEYFYWLLEKNRLQRVSDLDYFLKETTLVMAPLVDREAAFNALRRLQRREILRIGAQDILGIATMEETVGQVSALAEAILEAVLQRIQEGDGKGSGGFAVIAMGKLGGAELNFSSDIDLIFLYTHEEERVRMIRLAREYFKSLTEFTSEGHLYRVDLRLRPMGGSGEIAYSEDACAQYYQTWADTTDRLALIKSRFVAGDRELGVRFVVSVQDFVFKKYLDQAAVEEIRWIKKRTDRQLRRRQSELLNVKLGLGGIREIEFFAQSFQILYGGRHPELRTPNTLEALERLVDAGFVTLEEFESLRTAYRFLRDLEHKLQLVHDLQTHSLPREDLELARCARRMGYTGDEDATVLQRFQKDLDGHKSTVRTLFESLLQSEQDGSGFEELLLNTNMPRDEALERLKAAGIENEESMFDGLMLLREAPAFPFSPARMRNLLANLSPSLVEIARELQEPRELFARFDRFCDALGSRANLYAELIENPDFSQRLLTLLAFSPDLSETLVQYPELLDTIADSGRTEDYDEALAEFLSLSSEEFRDGLRRFKKREEFKIAINELAEPGDLDNREALSSLAEAALGFALRQALEEHQAIKEERFAFLALGKLAGSEVGFSSDLDLIFLYDDEHTQRTANDFRAFLKHFRNELFEYTAQGRAYEIDFRLRPEGTHGSEAVSITQLKQYFKGRVEPWERLAYVKSRAVLSQNDCNSPLLDLVFSQPFTSEERGELRHIRSRKEKEVGREEKDELFDIKVGRGGLLDIQFIVQYLQVMHEINSPKILPVLDIVLSEEILSSSEVSDLRSSLLFLFSLESLNDLVGGKDAKMRPGTWENRYLARLSGFESEVELLTAYRERSKRVRDIFDLVFGG